MKNIILLLLFLNLGINSFAQIPNVVHHGPVGLVSDLLGGGVTVSNVTYNGDLAQIGRLTDGFDKFGFSNGVIMATGNAKYAERFQNNFAGGSYAVESTNSDIDLHQISGPGIIVDAAVLEFDFVSTGDLAEFEFVFASEEYPEEVGSPFNDAFGFFVSGPGINGPYSNNSENIALVPGTNTPISINTVNQISNTSYYIANYFVNQGYITEDIAQLIYDGYTQTIKLQFDVECGETYHIKLAIGNKGDHNKDSAVILKNGSLKSDFVISPISADVQPICEGQNLNLSVQGDNGWQYDWNTGQSGTGLKNISTIADPNNVNYSVTATHPTNGCTLTQTINVDVHPLNNVAPYVNGINNTGEYMAYVQAGSQICFDIPSFDNPSEPVEISAVNGTLPIGASFNDNVAVQETGTFCWTPTVNDVGLHTFEVKVEDKNVCEVKSRIYTFTVKVFCEHCPHTVYYENRSPNGLPLPELTEAGYKIVAGTSVDPTQTDGPVITGTANVEFRAPIISLQTGFTGGTNFLAVPDTFSCTQSCDDCCENWGGFNALFPNVITPNGDGINDVWNVIDELNPYCAYNATGYNLVIKSRFGNTIYQRLESHASCCPFESVAPNNPIPNSSIHWNGRINNTGAIVSGGEYFYVLTLTGCGNEQGYAGSIYVIDGRSEINEEGLGSSKEVFKQTSKTEGITEPLIGADRKVELIAQDEPIIYPNPADDNINIALLHLNCTIEIVSLDGKRVFYKEAESLNETLNIANLSKGAYLVKISTANNVYIKRIIKN